MVQTLSTLMPIYRSFVSSGYLSSWIRSDLMDGICFVSNSFCFTSKCLHRVNIYSITYSLTVFFGMINTAIYQTKGARVNLFKR